MKVQLENVSQHTIFADPALCVNQVSTRTLSGGDIVAVFNQERYPYHHDSGQTLLTRSSDGGSSWTQPTVVLPWSDRTGNWDCGFCELEDGTWMVNLAICGYFKRGVRPEGVSWSSGPLTEQWGDWSWAHKLQSWLGTFVLKSTNEGRSWTEPIPVNVRPMKHGGCRLGAWQMPSGSLFLGLYGRLEEYGHPNPDEAFREVTRSALLRSDDGGDNWEYYSTLAYDPASIINFEEPALLRLDDGTLVCFLRTHVKPSFDSRNMAIVISEDGGFCWSPPRWTNIWGFPAEAIRLTDGRYLLVYGYRRPPYGVRGIVSEDGLNWDVADEFVVRQGGVPVLTGMDRPSSSYGMGAGGHARGAVDAFHPGIYQHIGYPSVVQLADGKVVVSYHEWSETPQPLQEVRCTSFDIA